MATDWQALIGAWLHDPPDKILDIQGHVARASQYLEAAIGSGYQPDASHADQVASATERLPVPHWQHLTIGPNQAYCVHPLSAEILSNFNVANLQLDVQKVTKCIQEIVTGVDDPKWRFFLLWRLLPEKLAEIDWQYGVLPADTRVPDHSIWRHLDTTAAIAATLSEGRPAFLCFSVGPVQQFIATARSVRDLWTGSMILSWITFKALLPLVDELGPTAIIYPALRGVPFLDLWLRKIKQQLADKIPMPPEDARKAPCLPNRFVALVPWGADGNRAQELARQCAERAKDAWLDIAKAVRNALGPKLEEVLRNAQLQDENADNLFAHWDWHIEHFFDFRVSVLSWDEADEKTLADLLAGSEDFEEAFPEAGKVRNLARQIPPNHAPPFTQQSAGLWQHRLELALRLLEAKKTLRHFPPYTQCDGHNVPPKCSICGVYEQLGPGNFQRSSIFWQQANQDVSYGGVRLREGERLCAVCFVKRFAGPAFFVEELELRNSQKLRFDDTSTIAAQLWLREAQQLGYDLLDPQKCRIEFGDWSGHWLHNEELDSRPKNVEEQVGKALRKLGSPPIYYATLMMDGDRMGEWLRGELSPAVKEVLHDRLRNYFIQQANAGNLLEAKRPVTPALHAAISEALANFALHFVPTIVQDRSFTSDTSNGQEYGAHGTLIYAGGDDVLALLPTRTSLACALKLRETFRKNWEARPQQHAGSNSSGPMRLLMGSRATVSAALVVAHRKEDLGFILRKAREAEKRAKQAGRDCIVIAICRRSGTHTEAICPWEFVEFIQKLVEAFANDASDRWLYHLQQELHILKALDPAAVQDEIRRQLKRTEKVTRKKLADALCNGREDNLEDILCQKLLDYANSKNVHGKPRFNNFGVALENYLTLCQSASFLARGTVR